MKSRTLGKTNITISEIGFGGWGIGRTWWGTVNDDESLTALKTAWDNGITFFDTAYVYGDGHSEELMGQALAGKPATIATKIPPKNGEWPALKGVPAREVFPPDWIIACTERSLKKLKRDILDLNQFHVWQDEWLKEDEWKEAIQKLKDQGKLKNWGVSINDHDPNSAVKLVQSGLADSVQVIFNIFDQSPTERLFPLCEEHAVGVIVRVPFDEGGLTGTLTKETQFEKGDFRRGYFKGNNLIETVERAEKLKTFLGNGTKTLPELALKFILAHKAVSTVIPGMRKTKNVLANVGVSDAPSLKPETLQALKEHAWPRNFYGYWED